MSHPFKDDPQGNKKRVDKICRKIILENNLILPISPLHLFDFLNNDGIYRDEILKTCKELIKVCDTSWFFVYKGNKLSKGQKIEYDFCKENGIDKEIKKYGELGYIYVLINNKNSKRYIGQTIDYERRKWEHYNLLRNNKHYNNHLQNSWNKYGENNFEFKIIEIPIVDKLNEKEKYWIKYYDTFKNRGYNLTEGGQANFKISEATKKYLSKIMSGKNNPNFGNKKMVGENNPNYGKKGVEHPSYGYTHSNEFKNRLSRLQSGENNNFYGKTHTEDVREKISKTHKGKKFTKEHREKLRKDNIDIPENYKEIINKKSKKKNKISMLDTKQAIEILELYYKKDINITQKELSDNFNVSSALISKVLNCRHWTTRVLRRNQNE